MRRLTVSGLLFLMCGMVVAAPGPKAPPKVTDEAALREQAARYASQVNMVLEQVSRRYVLAISREWLLETAVSALYRGAGRQIPRNLRERVEAACLPVVPRVRTVGMAPSPERPGEDGPNPQELLLANVRQELGCPGSLEGNADVLHSLRAVLGLLDKHSGLVMADEHRKASGAERPKFGPGMELGDRAGIARPIIETIYPGSPAQRAGLRVGDEITHVNGKPFATVGPDVLRLLSNQEEVVQVPLAPPGEEAQSGPDNDPTFLTLTCIRPGVKAPQQLNVARERFRGESVTGTKRHADNSWDYHFEDNPNLGYIRLLSLSHGTASELRLVLWQLQQSKVRGLVLDLRWCPGGYLHEAVEVAEMFLGACEVATVRTRDRGNEVFRSAGDRRMGEFTLVVLVNGETSGGAELIAAALRDHGRAIIVGQRTLGKASVQTPVSFGMSGVGLKLTTGTFTRPSGKNLHRMPNMTVSDDWGVVPDEEFRISPELSRSLQEWWQRHILQPASEPLRPREDAQRLFALRILKGRG